MVNFSVVKSALALIILVASLGLMGDAAASKTFSISIEDYEFDPDEITVKQGDTIIWTNYDSSKHTVTAADDSFDSGDINPDGTWSYQFNTMGTFDYSCDYNSGMQGAIVVQGANNVTMLNATTPTNNSFLPIESANNPVQLFWESYDQDGDSIDFEIFIGDSIDSLNSVSNTSEHYYNFTDYIFGKSYYWKVVSDDNYQNNYTDIWRFEAFDPNDIPIVIGIEAFYSEELLTLNGLAIDSDSLVACEWGYNLDFAKSLDSECVFEESVGSYEIISGSYDNSGTNRILFVDSTYYFLLRVQDEYGVWSEWKYSEIFYIDDGDGIVSPTDQFPLDPTQWTDRDYDGYGDNPDGNNPDKFPDDPNEWVDSDGDGIGDNSDIFISVANNILYAAGGMTIGLLCLVGFEMGNRSGIPKLIEGLESLISDGMETKKINDAIAGLKGFKGITYFNSNISDARSALSEGFATQNKMVNTMTDLANLREEVTEIQQQGIEVTDLLGSVNNLEVELVQQAESDFSVTYLETLQNKFVKNQENEN